MTRVPKAYKENYPIDDDDKYIDNVSNKDLRDLIIYNRQAIENWQEDFKNLKNTTIKLQSDFIDARSDIRSIKDNVTWSSSEYVDTKKRLDTLEKNLIACPICSDRINIEELSKTIVALSQEVESLGNQFKEMKDNRKEITTNTLVWITIIVTLISSVVAAILSKIL